MDWRMLNDVHGFCGYDQCFKRLDAISRRINEGRRECELRAQRVKERLAIGLEGAALALATATLAFIIP